MKKLIAATALAMLSACLFDSKSATNSSTSSSSSAAWIQIADTTSAAGLAVHLYAQVDTLGTGYQKLKICLHNHDQPSLQNQGLQLSLMPWMTMMSKSHSSPVENPSQPTDSLGCAQGAVVFTMPSNAMEGWSLGLKFGTDSARIPLWIKTQDKVLMSADPADTSKRVLIAWVGPQKLLVGPQSVELAVFRKNSMMDFPADTSWSFQKFEPTMPSMGHGSPGNALPTLKNGHYFGKLNFTMSGDWNIALGLRRGSDSLVNLSWDKTVVEK